MGWWKRKRREETGSEPAGGGTPDESDCRWIEAADNPWGVRVLDVRPLTLTALSGSTDPECGKNAISWGHVTGAEFAGARPEHDREIPSALAYRIDGALAEGVLCAPRGMEDKWAIFYYGAQILFVRSWTRQLALTAVCRVEGDELVVRSIRGSLKAEAEDPAFTERFVDFLIRTHALRLTHPAPLPAEYGEDVRQAASWCFGTFGRGASFAAVAPLPFEIPPVPLRSVSLLHLATVWGDRQEVKNQLALGTPLEVLGVNGQAPVHWALSSSESTMFAYLLELGANVDVRSATGATPLMVAVERKKAEFVRQALGGGAAVNARDERGFTSLHRAAEMGEIEILRTLLAAGADATATLKEGHNAAALAEAQGHEEILALLRPT